MKIQFIFIGWLGRDDAQNNPSCSMYIDNSFDHTRTQSVYTVLTVHLLETRRVSRGKDASRETVLTYIRAVLYAYVRKPFSYIIVFYP